MGTRGLRVVRFRKRYYQFFNRFDSYPEYLGSSVAANIPADAVKYQEWLTTERKSAEEWEALYEAFLTVKPGNENPADLPEFMQQQIPSLLAPLNDLFMEWIYIVDLDREVFSVNNGAHFKLDQVPHIDWIKSLTRGSLGDQISVPGTIPLEVITSLVAERTFQTTNLSQRLSDLDNDTPSHKVVIPKGIEDIPWRQRHGPILRGLIFHSWSNATEDTLSASLLQFNPEDFPFREIAYAVLCLAAGGRNASIVSTKKARSNGVFGFMHGGSGRTPDSEFISILASGAHLQGSTPGSSPDATIYWLENVLVVLTAQLYLPGAADEGIERIVHYCNEAHSTEYVNAVLMSIEHVILVHVSPGGKVQRTNIMPLFTIEVHLSMAVQHRYAKAYLKKLAAAKDKKYMKKDARKQRKAQAESMLKNDGVDLHYGDSDDGEVDSDDDEVVSDGDEESALHANKVEGDTISTFYALVHLFEAAACNAMSIARTTDGLLPNEIYTEIVKHVLDMETRDSLMKVSRTFRRICQEDFLLTEDMIFTPSDDCQDCDEARKYPKRFEKYDIASGVQSQVGFNEARGFRDNSGDLLKVSIGTEHGKKSLLQDVGFRLGKWELDSAKSKEAPQALRRLGLTPRSLRNIKCSALPCCSCKFHRW